MTEGQVVFVFANGDWLPVRVVSVRSGKVEVENPSGVRQVYAERRIARRSAKQVISMTALGAYVAELNDLKAGVDMDSVWELLGEEQTTKHSISDLAELAISVSSATADDAMAWALFDDGIFFKERKDGSYGRNSAAAVESALVRIAAEARTKTEFEGMSQWLLDRGEPRPPEAKKAIDALKQLVLHEDQGRACKLARSLLRSCFPQDSRADVWIAWGILRDLDEWAEDENLAVLRSELPGPIADSVTAAAEELAANPPSFQGHSDYRHLTTVAIDDAHTTEVDDALAVEQTSDGGVRLYVFITDVVAWVPDGHLVEEEARKRGATLYLPEGKVTMMPAALAEKCASLNAGEDRGVLAFVTELNNEGRVIEFQVEEALACVDARLTYTQVDRILDGAESPYSEALALLSQAAELLRANRREAGAMVLDRLEVGVHVDLDGAVNVSAYRTDDRSRYLVSELMILSGARTAEWCRERVIPAVYRAQDPPEEKPIVPTDRQLSPSELNQILRTFRKAEMRSKPMPHAGLGVPCYTQVTSPLRRYQDFVMHRQIKGYLRFGVCPWTESRLMGVLQEVERTQAVYGRVEKETRRYWLLKSLVPRVGDTLEVEVLRKAGGRFVVQILENGLQAQWSPTQTVTLGERIQVTLKSSDPRKDKLVLK